MKRRDEQITVDDLWQSIHRLAELHPDATDDLVVAALTASGAGWRIWRGVLAQLAWVDGRREPRPWEWPLMRRAARVLAPGAGQLLAYISGYVDAGWPWGRIPSVAADFDLAAMTAARNAALRRALKWPGPIIDQ